MKILIQMKYILEAIESNGQLEPSFIQPETNLPSFGQQMQSQSSKLVRVAATMSYPLKSTVKWEAEIAQVISSTGWGGWCKHIILPKVKHSIHVQSLKIHLSVKVKRSKHCLNLIKSAVSHWQWQRQEDIS